MLLSKQNSPSYEVDGLFYDNNDTNEATASPNQLLGAWKYRNMGGELRDTGARSQRHPVIYNAICKAALSIESSK